MKYISNIKANLLDFLLCDSPQAAFERFVSRPISDQGTDDLTHENILHHYCSFAHRADLPNLHFAHCVDLSADLPGHIRRYATMIGIEAPDQLVAYIATATSFGSMKETARQRLGGIDDGAFLQVSTFFDSATNNKWKGYLSDAELASYRTRFSALATPEEIDWLENGSGAS
jgi:hypothetical protein